MTQWGVTDTSY